MTDTATITPPPLPELPVEATPAKKSSRKRKGLIIGGSIAAGLALIIGIGAANAGSSDAPAAAEKAAAAPAAVEKADAEPVKVVLPAALIGMQADAAVNLLKGMSLNTDYTGPADATVTAVTPGVDTQVKVGSTVSLTVQEKPKLTLAQENALQSAKSYLDMGGFSRTKLIDQLSSQYGEGFTVEDATWAADNAGADWNAQAVASAKSYISMGGFSKAKLYDQLTSQYGEAFTPDQANQAIAAVGY